MLCEKEGDTHTGTLGIIFFTLMLNAIGFGMIIPIIPKVFIDPTSPAFVLFGYSQKGQLVMAGVASSVFGFMQFFASPIIGDISDTFGRKRVLSIGAGVLAISQFLFGFGIETASLALLIISRMIGGLAASHYGVACASIADISDSRDRAKNFGLTGGASGVGFIVGPLLGGWIADRYLGKFKTKVILTTEQDKISAFTSANLALAKSGTNTLEMSIYKLPLVVTYHY